MNTMHRKKSLLYLQLYLLLKQYERNTVQSRPYIRYYFLSKAFLINRPNMFVNSNNSK